MRNIRAAAVSAAPLAALPGATPQETLDAMRRHWRDRLDTVLPDRPDIIVLPEHCDRPRGATFEHDFYREYLELRGESTLEMLADVARRHRTTIAYPSHRQDASGAWFNSTQVIDRDGSVAGIYDKVFLTIGEHEINGLRHGREAVAVELDFGRVAPVICFDLNFEEFREQVAALRPDLLLFSSAFHGGYLQEHWAYTIGAHMIASVYPPAVSGILSPTGEHVARTTNYRDEVVANINLDARLIHIDHNHPKFADIKAAYGPRVRIHDPGLIGVVLLISDDDAVTADDVIAEFELEPVLDYFDRVRAHRDSVIARAST
ncbi:carbon-nitrogen hydrolase family protein [Georgenia subflava]|uniref:Carbon-nitrogen hydrolase family protein n=1 Tax=Georgenia subflava TaxID=1622177 RepID=A0A6N7EEJ7_9MICO|nr:carbon-nitrogen hydrolase family protein [Georgenia subflava]MPV35613.1 carbon-nitrogen hydrolase family protein [Georgenia subflava]